MILSQNRFKLLEYVKYMHKGQYRKYPEELEYWNHCFTVAEMVHDFLGIESLGIEAAFCHDLIEDTKCTSESLDIALLNCGYDDAEIRNEIIFTVEELTDVFTTEDFPHMNRDERKLTESQRLSTTSPLAQSVKYADLIDNTGSIVKYDKKFAKRYLPEKRRILGMMRSGNIGLYIECCYTLRKSELLLEQSERDRNG